MNNLNNKTNSCSMNNLNNKLTHSMNNLNNKTNSVV